MIVTDGTRQYPSWERSFQVVTIQDTRPGGRSYNRWVDLYSGEIIEDIAPILAQVENKLQRLANAKGRDATRLMLADESALTLLNGRRIVSMKAVDRTTGEIVATTFDGDQVVNEQELRAQAGAQWRAQHGALTPELVMKLATLKPADRVSVALWLAVEIKPLPKTEHLPPAQITSREPGLISIDSPEPTLKPNPLSSNGDKPLATPIPWDQVSDDLKARLSQPSVSPNKQLDVEKPFDENKQETTPTPAVVLSNMTLEQARAFDEQNRAAIRAQIAPVRGRILELLSQRGLTVKYASETAPIVYLELTRQQIEALANLPDIDAIYYVPNEGGPTGRSTLSSARPAQNADLINNVGYNGNGVGVAVVEGDRVFDSNPFLTVTGNNDSSKPTADHPTAVGGIIKSTNNPQHGLASSATLYSAAGSTFGGIIIGGIDEALDWASTNANVLNNSYWFPDDGSSSSYSAQDRHIDYIVRYNYDFAAVAAGNHGASGCPRFTSYVTSPGKGFNAMTVGDYTDNDTPGWAGDSMAICSGFGDPIGDGTSYTHAKPKDALRKIFSKSDPALYIIIYAGMYPRTDYRVGIDSIELRRESGIERVVVKYRVDPPLGSSSQPSHPFLIARVSNINVRPSDVMFTGPN